ncbi:hypothetical protein LWI28_013177 [Acer negundo]|uniref:Uncharacterized protein n=1 Tax=Acer negundo TaxID=4023 RepID=A0AAD5NQG5_ACENE|nr:hypothetical protein LWI28_013177 [Acer negundo]
MVTFGGETHLTFSLWGSLWRKAKGKPRQLIGYIFAVWIMVNGGATLMRQRTRNLLKCGRGELNDANLVTAACDIFLTRKQRDGSDPRWLLRRVWRTRVSLLVWFVAGG